MRVRSLKHSWPAVAIVAAFFVGSQLGSSFTGEASAQVRTTGTPDPTTTQGTPTTSPPFNAAEQRQQQTAALDQINRRLAAIEAKLNSGISVKVTEMPAVIVKEPAK
jgi:hypothetical protein